MMRWISTLTFLIVLLACQANVMSAEIKLKYGAPVKGTVIEVNDDGIVILLDFGIQMALPKNILHEDSLKAYGFGEAVVAVPALLPQADSNERKPEVDNRGNLNDQKVPSRKLPHKSSRDKIRNKYTADIKKVDSKFDDPSIQTTLQLDTNLDVLGNLDKLLDRHLLRIQPHTYRLIQKTTAQLVQLDGKARQVSDLIKFPQDPQNKLHRIFRSRKTYKLQVEKNTPVSVYAVNSNNSNGLSKLERTVSKRSSKHSKAIEAVRIAKQADMASKGRGHVSLQSDVIRESESASDRQNNGPAMQRNYRPHHQEKDEPLAWTRFSYILWDHSEKRKWQISLNLFGNISKWMR